MSITPVMVEIDCMEAAKLVNSPEICWGEEGHLVEDIKTLLPAIGANQVLYRRRECVAHEVRREFDCVVNVSLMSDTLARNCFRS